ncbi:DUF11 domain-containing protein [Paenibacillus cellulosilyticus]|uniref:DUF7507 domain-containing protein n=1 Tax=Paenibacillus cellulosilyticus TaxID=375489 RepID=UPI001580F7D9|nr:DUF11 domain-containing protein [Paenibacillus cellulosilyticus]QKS44683.1 DUF11 domain-containing protein [Paenibacillus cellulosilyticus]
MEPCSFQGPGKQNPVFIGGYDNPRPTNDPSQPDYWIGSGQSVLFDAALNNGAGGFITASDLVRISKNAVLHSSEECDCVATVTVDIEAHPVAFGYFPPHSLDVIFVLDVTSSMMSNASLKFTQAKRALISTINQLWASNRNTTVTIIPYGRDAFLPVPSPGTGFSYNYLGTLFQWKRSYNPPPSASTYYISQILGYRQNGNISNTVLTQFLTQSAPLVANIEQSLYNFYNYYKIQYSDIYDDAGNPLPDTVLSNYITTVYNPNVSKYSNNPITNIANNTPLSAVQLTYSMNDTGYANNTILQNMVWAIPYSEDTNTEAGMQAAYNLFTTPDFAQSDDPFRRCVILITDGQANRSINPDFSQSYAALGDTDSTFFPDVAGEPWKYFTQLQQTLPTLVAEMSSRSSTFNEIILSSTRVQQVADKLKDPADGNVQIYALGIDISAQSPGPYTRDDVINWMKSWVSAPAFFRESTTTDPQSQIEALLTELVQDVLSLFAGSRLVFHDGINTALFQYVPGTIQIHGVRDGLKLKSPNQPDIIDPADPDFTIYPKAPLLPDVTDNTVVNGTITIDYGVMPLGMLTRDSLTTITLTYQVQSNPFANGDHLHTNTDNQTFVSFIEPNHTKADSSVIDYSAEPQSIFFQTPIIACTCTPFADVSILKVANRSSARPLDEVIYFIEVTNTGTLTLTNLVVDDPLLGVRFTIPSLEPLASFGQSFSFTIPSGTPQGPFTNTASVVSNETPDPQTADASVLIALVPSLLFTKSVNRRVASPGSTVIFTLRIVNNGEVNLNNVHLTDSLLGIDTIIDHIAIGADLTIDLPFVIPEDAAIGSTILNVATIAPEGLPPITVGVDVEVEAVPRLQIEKVADRQQVEPGQTVVFTITVTNNGDTTLTNVRVIDATLGLDTTLPSLFPGQSIPVTVNFLIPLETTPKQYTNTSIASSDQTQPVEASEAVEVLPTPAIGIRKVPDRQTVTLGGTIHYQVTVTNFGNVALGPSRVIDPLLGVDMTIPALAIGEIRAIPVTYQVPSHALIGSVIDNMITVQSPEAGTAQAEAIVTVVGLGLALTKTADRQFAIQGDTMFYTLTVTNLTDAPQTNVVLADETLGFHEVIPVLDAGATIERTISFVVPSVPDGTALRNIATCSSDQSPPEQAEAVVGVNSELVFTTLRVTKIPDKSIASPGETIVYTASVTNTGSSTATTITLRDSLTGTQFVLPSLAPGEKKFVTFSYTVPVNTKQGTVIHNVVLVTSPQTDPITAEADVPIALPHALLELTKTADRPSAKPGETVYFRISVTNKSAIDLHTVRVFDNLTQFSTVIPVLHPGETRAFAQTFQIPLDARGGDVFVNTATAFSDETPFEQASVSVSTVSIPEFTLKETVDRPVVFGGETILFTIHSENVGNVDLINFVLRAPLFHFVLRIARFQVGGKFTGRFPFVTPEVEDDTVFISPVTAQADNKGPKHVEASVLVLPEDDE